MNKIGTTLQQERRFTEAELSYRPALRLAPNSPAAQLKKLYTTAAPDHTAASMLRVTALDAQRTGIFRSGNPTHGNEQDRSIHSRNSKEFSLPAACSFLTAQARPRR